MSPAKLGVSWRARHGIMRAATVTQNNRRWEAAEEMRMGRFLGLAVLLCTSLGWSQSKPKLTLDEYFTYVGIRGVRISPDGNSVVVGTTRADWAQDKFRHDLWLVRNGSAPVLLTSAGEDSDPEWSPDGKWIAFLSDRPGGIAQLLGPTGGIETDERFHVGEVRTVEVDEMKGNGEKDCRCHKSTYGNSGDT